MSDALVLCYHALSEDWPAALSTTPERFAAQLRLLERRGYRGVTFSELVAGGEGKRVAITFDDAYRSVGRLAKPILDRVGFPATVFVADRLRRPGAPDGLAGHRPLARRRRTSTSSIPHSWEELRRSGRRGLGDRFAHLLPPAPHDAR